MNKKKKQIDLPYVGLNKTQILPNPIDGIDAFNNSVDVGFTSGNCSFGESFSEDNIKFLKQSLVDAITDYFISEGFDEDDALFYYNVDFEDEGDRYKVEVRAELSFDEQGELCEILDPIIQQYDEDAYFDMEDFGILNAFITKENSTLEESLSRIDKSSRLSQTIPSDTLGLYEEIKHNLNPNQKRELQDFARKATTAEEVDTFVKGLLSDDGKNKSVNEDLEEIIDVDSSNVDNSYGISNMIIDLINKKYDLVSSINSVIVTLTDEGTNNEMIPVLSDIVVDENNNIGKLQQLVEMIRPESSEIENGKVEVEQSLGVSESLKNKLNIKRNKDLKFEKTKEEVQEQLTLSEDIEEEPVDDKIYYVSYYEEYPKQDEVKDTAGKGCELIDSVECHGLENAKETIREMAEEDGIVEKVTDEFYIDRSRYVSQDRFYIVETEQGSEII